MSFNWNNVDWNSNAGYCHLLANNPELKVGIIPDWGIIRDERNYSDTWRNLHPAQVPTLARFLRDNDRWIYGTTGWNVTAVWSDVLGDKPHLVPYPLKGVSVPTEYNHPVWWIVNRQILEEMAIEDLNHLPEDGQPTLLWFHCSDSTSFVFSTEPDTQWYWCDGPLPYSDEQPMGTVEGASDPTDTVPMRESYLMLSGLEYKLVLPEDKAKAGEAMKVLLDTEAGGACWGGRLAFLSTVFNGDSRHSVLGAGDTRDLMQRMLVSAYATGNTDHSRYALAVVRALGGRLVRSTRPVFTIGQHVRRTSDNIQGRVIGVGTSQVSRNNILLPPGVYNWTDDLVIVAPDDEAANNSRVFAATREQLAAV